jgi:hypothetical protein
MVALPVRVVLAAAASCALAPAFPLAAQSGAPPRSPEEQQRLRLQTLARDARNPSDRIRIAAWEELLSFGDEGIAILKPVVEGKLAKDRKAVEEWFAGESRGRLRRKLEDELVLRRKEALACIFDSARYPDEDHGAAGQPEVDRLVARVREAWEHPTAFARSLFEELDAAARQLEEDIVYLEVCGGRPPEELATVDGWLARYDARFERERLGISDGVAEWNREVRAYNAGEALTSATEEERACMVAVGDYREMLGLRVLEIDERLVRAARKHSAEMHELGYFSHTSPTPGLESPGRRCAREGYHGGGAENIAVGMTGGVDAFWCWYHSSGHHRNILGGHAQIGVGNCDRHWTQNFGGSSSLRGRKVDDPQILYLERLRRLDPTSADAEAAIASWCRANQLDDAMKHHAQRALALDPEHEKAHALLGEVRVDGRWVPKSEGRRPDPASRP